MVSIWNSWRTTLGFSPARLLGGVSSFVLLSAFPAPAQEPAVADVVVIVDTSTSMRDAGMDPERASLLVAKLFADIVPGDLAVVRLLDIQGDQDVLPHRTTNEFSTCVDDPSQQCQKVEAVGDWEAEARSKKLGALVRIARGDGQFKQELERHLEQRINNSMFVLAFRSAQGVFDEHRGAGRPADVPRTVVWLSDGRSESPEAAERSIRDLVRGGIGVEAIVFGQGDTALAQKAGLPVSQVSGPAGIMKAFASAFRRIVHAPYEVDGTIASQPSFNIARNVDEAWVVVYGDDSLAGAEISGPQGKVSTDFAADRWAGAGAYRVAHLDRPTTGKWTVRAEGGGGGVAYAVVQRSALGPVLLAPKSAISGSPVALVAGVRAGDQGEIVTDPEVLRDLEVTAELDGRVVRLTDGGKDGDAVAGDGRFSAPVELHGTGKVPVRLRIRGPLVDRAIDAFVEVEGSFRYRGGPIELDLGTLKVASESCRPLPLSAEHVGEVPFTVELMQRLPPGHQLEVRTRAGLLAPGGAPVALGPGVPFTICLGTAARAPSSVAKGETWLVLLAAGGARPEHRVEIRLRWRVEGLTFWQRWGWLILLVLLVLALLIIVLGFILPHRFPGGFAVAYAPDRGDLDEQTAQPVKQWGGVRIGFYRDARAYLHADFRISGNPQGAVAGLIAEKGGARVAPGRGLPLHRETLDGDWEDVVAEGRKARGGDVFRIGDRGPYFRIATRGSR